MLLADALQKDWHWAEAEVELRQAIELSPSNAGAHSGLAGWLHSQNWSSIPCETFAPGRLAP